MKLEPIDVEVAAGGWGLCTAWTRGTGRHMIMSVQVDDIPITGARSTAIVNTLTRGTPSYALTLNQAEWSFSPSVLMTLTLLRDSNG